MNITQTPSHIDYQTMVSPKEQYVKDYETMSEASYEAMAAAHHENGFITRQMVEEHQAKGIPFYFTFECGNVTAKLDLLSKGDKELSQEQLEYLKANYDTQNMSDDDKVRMLSDLTFFGVISGKQAFSEVMGIRNQHKIPIRTLGEGQRITGASVVYSNVETDAKRLRKADTLEDWTLFCTQKVEECDADIERLGSYPYACLQSIEGAKSQRDYYEKIEGIFGMMYERNV